MDPNKPYQATPAELLEAHRELARQDARRGNTVTIDTVHGPKTFVNYERKPGAAEAFRMSFMHAISYEFAMAAKWGAEADLHGNEVIVPIRVKYPPRTYGKFETWLRKFKNKQGVVVFQFEPRLKGFIFNEAGRGVTLSVTRMIPFRLYVAGWVLNLTPSGKWSFKHR